MVTLVASVCPTCNVCAADVCTRGESDGDLSFLGSTLDDIRQEVADRAVYAEDDRVMYIGVDRGFATAVVGTLIVIGFDDDSAVLFG